MAFAHADAVVSSLTGTANQVIVSAAVGAVTVSLPQDIHTAATPRFAALGLGGAAGAAGIKLYGVTSGSVTVVVPAAAGSNTITLPAGTTDFSATGGASQVVKQTSVGGAFTVAQLAFTDLSGTVADGQLASAYVKRDGTTPLTANWNAGAFTITASKFAAGVSAAATGSIDLFHSTSTFKLTLQAAAGQIAADRTITFPDPSTTSAIVVYDGKAQTLTNKTFTQPNIADFSGAQHTHANAPGGGQLTSTNLSDTANLARLDAANVFSSATGQSMKKLLLPGSTSGTLTVLVAAAAGSSTLTLPGGTTDFSATGGTSRVLMQTSAGGAITVAQLAASNLSNGTTGSGGGVVLATGPTITDPVIVNIAPGADFTLTQNSVAAFTSENTGALVNTLRLKAGNVGIGKTPSATVLLDMVKTQDAATLVTLTNGSAGTSAKAVVQIVADGNGQLQFAQYGSGNTSTKWGVTLGGYSEVLGGILSNGMAVGTFGATPLFLGANSVAIVKLTSGGGVQVMGAASAAPTGGDKGTGTINASVGYYVNGAWSVAISSGNLFISDEANAKILMRFTPNAGVQIGAPTGGDKGANTLSIQGAYYSNGTLGVGTVGTGTAVTLPLTAFTTAGGLVTVATGTSDARLKTVYDDVASWGRAELRGIVLRRFSRVLPEPGPAQWGFVAQDVERTFQAAIGAEVWEHEDPTGEHRWAAGSAWKTVDERILLGTTIKVVNELTEHEAWADREIAKLQARIDQLEATRRE